MTVTAVGPYSGAPGGYPSLVRDVPPTEPLVGSFTVAASDTVDLPRITRQIYAAGAGNVSVIWADGSETVEPVAAGDRLDWRLKRIKATGTTATGLRGYY